MNTSRAKRMLAAAGIAGAMSLGTAGVASATPAPVSLSVQLAAPASTAYLGAPPVLRPGRGSSDVEIGGTE